MDSISHNFFNENNWKTSVDIVRRYRCHRSGNYVDKCEQKNSKRKRRLKVGGTKKLQSFCPAEYTIRESLCDKSCTVILQNVHVGHDIHDIKELQFARLSKAEKQDIAEKLILNVPENTILDNIYHNGIPSRFIFTNKQDIRNIARKISRYILENDTAHVETLAH